MKKLHNAIQEKFNKIKTVVSVHWGSITGKPETFTPSAHSHSVEDLTDYTPSGSFEGDLDDIEEGTTNKHFTDTEKTKLANLAAVAVTGSYTDLEDIPNLPTILSQAQVLTRNLGC